jgi:hypothetical protein
MFETGHGMWVSLGLSNQKKEGILYVPSYAKIPKISSSG